MVADNFYDLIFIDYGAAFRYNQKVFATRADYLEFLDFVSNATFNVLANSWSENMIRNKMEEMFDQLISENYLTKNDDGTWCFCGR